MGSRIVLQHLHTRPAGDGRDLVTTATTTESVADAMVTTMKTLEFDATVNDVREFFLDDHVHMALVVRHGKVVTAIERADLSRTRDMRRWARDLGTLVGRSVRPSDDLASVHRAMVESSRRRLVVVDATRELLGLLCLKRHGRSFCRDEDVLARQLDVLGCD